MAFYKNIKTIEYYSSILRHRAIKFGIKLGIVTGTAYYISEQGVWKDSETTLKLYNGIKTNVSPYTQKLTAHIPYELPSLPNAGEISYVSKYYWNKGVLASFAFLANIPSYITKYSTKGLNVILDNTEVKDLIDPKTEIKP